LVALAVGVAVVGPLAMAAPSFASNAPGEPAAGGACISTDGKISGRGGTLQLWAQYDLANAFATDVCGSVAADPNANATVNASNPQSGDITDPGFPFYDNRVTGYNQFGQNWETAYNYPNAQNFGASGANAAIGSGAGQAAIDCRAEAFSTSDIPVTPQQFSVIDGPVTTTGEFTFTPAAGSAFTSSKNCTPESGVPLPLVNPFTPNGPYPNAGDQQGGALVIPDLLSAISTFANLPTTCATGQVALTQADVAGIWSGAFTNWNQISAFGGKAACNVPITLVVRSDNSGTSQGFLNYLADSNGYGYDSGACYTANHDSPEIGAGNGLGAQQNDQYNYGNNYYWPQGSAKNGVNLSANAASGGAPAPTGVASGCSGLESSTNPGGPALIKVTGSVNGAAGYADLADTLQDTTDYTSTVTGDSIVTFELPNSTTGAATSPGTTGATGSSNCTTSAGLPGSGGANGAVGLGGQWNLSLYSAATDAKGAQAQDDVAYWKEGASYPACTLSWLLAWSGEDGNSPSAPSTANASAVTIPAAGTQFSLAISPTAGIAPAPGATATTVGYAPQDSWLSIDPTTGAATTTPSSAVTVPAGGANGISGPFTLPVASAAGLPAYGSFTDATNGLTFTYNGISANNLTGVLVNASGGGQVLSTADTLTFGDTFTVNVVTATSATLTPLAPVSGTTIPSGAAVTAPFGTGGPEAGLTPDQRRTLYDYVTYVESPLGQAALNAGISTVGNPALVGNYQALPASWLATIDSGFQGNY
jgi:ABC-type phosphate transport system substrate-binding protein